MGKGFNDTEWNPPQIISIKSFIPVFILIYINLYFVDDMPLIIGYMYEALRWLYFISSTLVILGILVLCKIFTTHGIAFKFWGVHEQIMDKWEKFHSMSIKFIFGVMFQSVLMMFIYFYMQDYYLFTALIMVQFTWMLYMVVVETSRLEFIYALNYDEDDTVNTSEIDNIDNTGENG